MLETKLALAIAFVAGFVSWHSGTRSDNLFTPMESILPMFGLLVLGALYLGIRLLAGVHVDAIVVGASYMAGGFFGSCRDDSWD